jgi:hypothetical protein
MGEYINTLQNAELTISMRTIKNPVSAMAKQY